MNKKSKDKLQASIIKKHRRDSAYKNADTLDFTFTIIMVILAIFVFRLFIFEPIRVAGDSMKPTLLDGERMFVEKVSYMFHEPERGDIVICYYPNRGNSTFVKRVVGLPGETIEILDGFVYINGELLDESDYWNDYINGEYGPIVIPDDCVFVMGDNRNHSGDSREGSVGPIPLYRIVGRVHGVVWPFDGLREL